MRMRSVKSIRPPRPLTTAERDVLTFLLDEPFPGRDALRRQLVVVKVCEEYGEGDPSVVLCFDPAHPQGAAVTRRVPVEAETVTEDGVGIHVLLHVVDGLLNELEVFREDSQVVQMPAPGQLKLLHLDEEEV